MQFPGGANSETCELTLLLGSPHAQGHGTPMCRGLHHPRTMVTRQVRCDAQDMWRAAGCGAGRLRRAPERGGHQLYNLSTPQARAAAPGRATNVVPFKIKLWRGQPAFKAHQHAGVVGVITCRAFGQSLPARPAAPGRATEFRTFTLNVQLWQRPQVVARTSARGSLALWFADPSGAPSSARPCP